MGTFEDYIDVSKYFLKPNNNPFKVVIKNGFRNAKLIHPVHQRYISEIINELKKYKSVKKIIVFGSSVTKRCTYESDIDLYVELSKDEHVNTYNVDCPVDFWTNNTAPKDFLKEILKTGVVVYKRRI